MADETTTRPDFGTRDEGLQREEATWDLAVDEAIAEALPSPVEAAAGDEIEAPDSIGDVPIAALDYLTSAAANVYDVIVRRRAGPTTERPFTVVHRSDRLTVRRYAPQSARTRNTLLLIPPLGAPVSCYDLRPGASVVEHMTWSGVETFVADYGPIGFAERGLGLEHWVGEVIPEAIRAAAADSGGQIHLAGWSLGGILSLLTVAAASKLPVRTLTMIASPVDFNSLTLLEPVRQIGRYTDRRIITGLYRALGAAPAPLVSLVFRGTAIGRYLSRPLFVARNLANREALVHMRATDRYMANMHAYPGRTIGQLYHKFFWDQELSNGKVMLGDRRVELSSVSIPVLAAASDTDVLAPSRAAFHVSELVPNSPDVRLKTVPGGHLGVLTGMAARNHLWRHMLELMDDYEPGPPVSG